METMKTNPHYITNLGNGNVEVEFKGENSPSEQHDKHNKGGILKFCQLHLQWTKLHPPADGGVGRRWFEPHALPVGGLDVLMSEEW